MCNYPDVWGNELSSEEALAFEKVGLKPGDEEWERRGICQSVTWPRSKHSILGKRNDGMVLDGEYFTGNFIEKPKSRRFHQIGFASDDKPLSIANKKQLVALIGKKNLPQSSVKKDSDFIVSEKYAASVSVLFDEVKIDEWLQSLEGQDHITDFYIVTEKKAIFNSIKSRINELLGSIIVMEKESRPMSEGFKANLEYFRLEFLDKNHVALGRQFREILPILWLRSGAIGPRPKLPANKPIPDILFSFRNHFAVLVDETLFADFLEQIKKKTGLSHVYLVTNSEESFQEMAEHLNVPNVIQLYRDYLENFVINKGENA